jgi:CO/xanthine dehydrogenase FAD-binding subunit
MISWEQYLRPDNLEEALAILAKADGSARVVAGGTDLLLDIQQGRHPPVPCMVDITGIPELRAIAATDDEIYLGAAVTHTAIVEDPLLNEHAPCLVEACALIGGPQVRNVATIGGNVAHALPAGDGTIALLALDAQAQIASQEGRRWADLEHLFSGPGQTTFDRSREILVGFRLKKRRPGETSAFRRIMRPQGVAIAILNMAAWMSRPAGSIVEDVRLAVGPAGPQPLRARKTEAVLRGRELSEDVMAEATEALLGEARLRTSPHRATIEYRRHLTGILLRRTINAAIGAVAAQEDAFA